MVGRDRRPKVTWRFLDSATDRHLEKIPPIKRTLSKNVTESYMEIPCAKSGLSDWLTAARPIGYLQYIRSVAAILSSGGLWGLAIARPHLLLEGVVEASFELPIHPTHAVPSRQAIHVI